MFIIPQPQNTFFCQIPEQVHEQVLGENSNSELNPLFFQNSRATVV